MKKLIKNIKLLQNNLVHSCHGYKVVRSFTMAEILISLTIIGIVAALTLPAIKGNIDERAWNVQRRALLTRMSQALNLMPNLNGYGRFEGTYSVQSNCHRQNQHGYCSDKFTNYGVDTAAMSFVTNGLSKVYKIDNICDNEHLGDCGLPAQYKNLANKTKEMPKRLTEYNPTFASRFHVAGSVASGVTSYGQVYGKIAVDTETVGIQTANGESMLVLYNPKCTYRISNKDIKNIMDNWTSSHGMETHAFQYFYETLASNTHAQSNMCVTFLYDLNGKKGPNKVYKDIGAISAFYPTDPEVVGPIFSQHNAHVANDNNAYTMNYDKVLAACKAEDKKSRIPSFEELKWLHINRVLLNDISDSPQHFSEDPSNSTMANFWGGGDAYLNEDYSWMIDPRGISYPHSRTGTKKGSIRCVKR